MDVTIIRVGENDEKQVVYHMHIKHRQRTLTRAYQYTQLQELHNQVRKLIFFVYIHYCIENKKLNKKFSSKLAPFPGKTWTSWFSSNETQVKDTSLC